jgi:hypothetical protein
VVREFDIGPTFAVPYIFNESGRLDQELTIAIRQSSLTGKPLTLPLDPAEQIL